MADLTITSCTIVKEIEGYDWPAGEDLNAGQYARQDTSTGKAVLGNASSAAEVGAGLGGIVTGQDADSGFTAHVLVDGIVDVGDALDSLTYDDTVFLSNTDGTFADAAGTVSTIKGYVVPGWGSTTPDKLLRIVRQ